MVEVLVTLIPIFKAINTVLIYAICGLLVVKGIQKLKEGKEVK